MVWKKWWRGSLLGEPCGQGGRYQLHVGHAGQVDEASHVMAEVVLKDIAGRDAAGAPAGDKHFRGAVVLADRFKVLGEALGPPGLVAGGRLGAALATGFVGDLER